MIIKLLTESPQISEEEVIKKLRVFSARIKKNFIQLIKEGLIKKKGQKFMIA
jgi:predicted transcriptional regulator